MPFTYTQFFRVGYRDCDALGFMTPPAYARALQDAAFEASTAAGFALDRYEDMHKLWLARGHTIEIKRPLTYREQFKIQTWVESVYKVSSRRHYRVTLIATDELIADAFTDWVLIDTTTGRPVCVPQEFIAAAFPEGPPVAAPPRDDFPPADTGSEDTFRMTRAVEWRDIDSALHVNNTVYFDYAWECTLQALAGRDRAPAQMRREGRGLVPARMMIRYSQPALPGHKLDITAAFMPSEYGRMVLYHTIQRSGEALPFARLVCEYEWRKPPDGFNPVDFS